jgi:translation initiation factor 5
VSEEAVRARMQDLTDGAKHMTINDDLEKSEKERMDIFYVLVNSKRDAGQLENAQMHKDLLGEAERLDIKTKAPLVLAEVLFDQNMRAQLYEYRMLLLRFCHNDKKAQRYLMGGFEQVIALHRDSLLNKVPGLLKILYDLDILSEAAIIAWAEKVRSLAGRVVRGLMSLSIFAGVEEVRVKRDQSRDSRQGRPIRDMVEGSRDGRVRKRRRNR